jgi:hypothetical protein
MLGKITFLENTSICIPLENTVPSIILFELTLSCQVVFTLGNVQIEF